MREFAQSFMIKLLKILCVFALIFPLIEIILADCKTAKDISFEKEAAFQFIKPTG